MPTDFQPKAILSALNSHVVDYVVVGGLAGIAYGSAYPTYDLDAAYNRDRANLERLAAALKELGAQLRGAPPDVPFILDARSVAGRANFTCETPYGSVDILGDAAGAPRYDVLKSHAQRTQIDGQPVLVASLDHLIAMKEAAGRTKDKLMATEYRVLSDQLRAPK